MSQLDALNLHLHHAGSLETVIHPLREIKIITALSEQQLQEVPRVMQIQSTYLLHSGLTGL